MNHDRYYADLATGNVSLRQLSVWKRLNVTSSAQFATLPLVKPVLFHLRVLSSTYIPILLLNCLIKVSKLTSFLFFFILQLFPFSFLMTYPLHSVHDTIQDLQ